MYVVLLCSYTNKKKKTCIPNVLGIKHDNESTYSRMSNFSLHPVLEASHTTGTVTITLGTCSSELHGNTMTIFPKVLLARRQ